ncbi:universal stress protein [Candidatus Uabimicrobium sp. HlEnr_7]|uniref:universal stress protein n=1 Tax=Candidatus Uabimicrobium helgolandensis TaxID=3095367 RepID=UPI00355646AF
MYNKILIPVDRSEDAKKAVDHGVTLADSFGSKVIILHCYDYPEILQDEFLVYGIPDSYIQGIKKNIENRSQEFLKDVENKFIEKNINVTIEFREGHPGTNIVNFAEENEVGLIVMGSRHMGTLKRIIFTSTSNYVLHHTNTPVFVI